MTANFNEIVKEAQRDNYLRMCVIYKAPLEITNIEEVLINVKNIACTIYH